MTRDLWTRANRLSSTSVTGASAQTASAASSVHPPAKTATRRKRARSLSERRALLQSRVARRVCWRAWAVRGRAAGEGGRGDGKRPPPADVHRLPTGGEDAQGGRGHQEAFRQVGGGQDDVFAVIQDQERAFFAQVAFDRSGVISAGVGAQ